MGYICQRKISLKDIVTFYDHDQKQNELRLSGAAFVIYELALVLLLFGFCMFVCSFVLFCFLRSGIFV